MTDSLVHPTYEKLYEEGDYYITPNDPPESSPHPPRSGFTRNTVIIHECPRPSQDHLGYSPEEPFSFTISMPNGETGECYYCAQTVPDTMQTIYKLMNFDCFASDSHETPRTGPWGHLPTKLVI